MSTATAEPGTESITAPVETPQSPVVDQAPPEQVASPEVSAPVEATAPPPPRSIDDIPDEELTEHPRIKKLREETEFRARQSEADKVKAENARALRQQQLNDFDRGAYQEAINAEYRKAWEAGTEPDPKALAAISQKFTNTAAYRAAITEWQMVQAGLSDWKWPAELVEESARLHTEVNAGRMHPHELAAFNLRVVDRAAFERGLEAGRDEGRKALLKEQAAAAETARLRDTTERAKDAPGPSGVSGTPAPVNHRAILNDMNRPIDERRSAFAAIHGERPPW